MSVVLDTTSPQWKYYAVIDGRTTATNFFGQQHTRWRGLPINPPSAALDFSKMPRLLSVLCNGITSQWTQVAPGGVPPYLLNPLPPTNSIKLTNQPVAIPATGFGSAPLGYYGVTTPLLSRRV